MPKFNTAESQNSDFQKKVIAETSSTFGSSQSISYVDTIQSEIDNTTNFILKLGASKKRANILGGDEAEAFMSGSFNIQSALQGKLKSTYADAPRVNGLGTSDIDVHLKNGRIISNQLKYGKNSNKSVNMQRTTYQGHYKSAHGTLDGFSDWFNKNKRPGSSPDSMIYDDDMQRIIPSDQLESGKKFISKKITKYSQNNQNQNLSNAKEVKNGLSDHIEGNGVSSSTLSKDESTQIASDAKKGQFDADDYGVGLKTTISNGQIHVLKQAMKTGAASAAITAIISELPTLLKVIQQIANQENIDLTDLSSNTGPTIANTTDAFLQSTITGYLTTNAASKVFGEKLASEAMKNLTPVGISSLVVFVYGTCKTYIQYARGKISTALVKDQVNSLLFSTIFTLSGSLLGATLGPIGMTLGSVIGSVIGGFVYQGIENLALSYSIKSGQTIFGLVEQDYTLTDEMVKQLGLERFAIDTLKFDDIAFNDFQFEKFNFETFNFSNIEVGRLRRGVIGVNKVGFIQ
ncbi:hypothetical protein [Furfurilactobacillus milii]|uniref:Uncharacterized protein n=1 Tax=Furfurilactobacillus milii TaxID=2888272 RepID=A0A6N9I4J5_9LACO|nr:hypothetical protein [Furfurilactobacillus milii]MYV17624.1 hypothetical protein [Furfurilactobacillus milii]